MRIFLLTLITTLSFGTAALAATPAALNGADHTITARINGLVCDFCARALEKVFGARDEVSGIAVDLNTKIVTIGLKAGADIDDATLTGLITDAGYTVEQITR